LRRQRGILSIQRRFQEERIDAGEHLVLFHRVVEADEDLLDRTGYERADADREYRLDRPSRIDDRLNLAGGDGCRGEPGNGLGLQVLLAEVPGHHHPAGGDREDKKPFQ
jgi:hypothetical protein